MKNRKSLTLILAAAVLVVLFGCWVFLHQRNDEAAKESSVAAEGEEVLSVDTKNLTEIAFQIGGEEYTFSKDGDSWTLASDANFPVDADKLTDAISSLSSLKSLRTISNAEDLSEYGLDSPQNTICVTDAQGEKTEIKIGDTNSDTGDDYVSISGKDDVYTVDNAILTSLPEKLTDVAKSDKFPSISVDHITKFTAQTGDTELVLEKHNDSWSATKGSDFSLADADSVKDFLQQDVTGLIFQDFVEYYCTDFSKYGLDEPYATITTEYTDDDGKTQEFRIYVGSQDKDKNYYVRFDGSQQVHTITASQINAIMSEEPSALAKSTEATTELGTEADLVGSGETGSSAADATAEEASTASEAGAPATTKAAAAAAESAAEESVAASETTGS